MPTFHRFARVVLMVTLLCHPALMAAGAVAPPTRGVAKSTRVTPLHSDTLLDVPPRYMWGWGPGLDGYCGETSFQSHGIFWGNYISSEIVRNAADRKELLLSVNAIDAANTLSFTYDVFDTDHTPTPQGNAFVAWSQSHIDAGHVVVAGVFEKQPSGDSDYDHIVPVVGYRAASASSASVSGLFFNDLYGRTSRVLSIPADVQTRSKCSQSSSPKQPYSYCLPSEYVHGMALTGIVDVYGETHRMVLKMPDWREPDWGKEDRLHEQVTTFTVSASIHDLSTGVGYSVLRFDNPSDVPTSDFLGGSYSKRFDFVASGSVHTLSNFDSFSSDASVFYRCVASGPI